MSKTRLDLHPLFHVAVIANVAFWLVLASIRWAETDFGSTSSISLSVLVSLEPVGYLLLYWITSRAVAAGCLLLVGFSAANAVLSITDEVGVLDAVSLALSVAMGLASVIALGRLRRARRTTGDRDRSAPRC